MICTGVFVRAEYGAVEVLQLLKSMVSYTIHTIEEYLVLHPRFIQCSTLVDEKWMNCTVQRKQAILHHPLARVAFRFHQRFWR